MDGSQTVGSTGTGLTACDPASSAPLLPDSARQKGDSAHQKEGFAPDFASLPCPLNDLSPELHQYIHGLEHRIVHLESEQKRFTNALLGAGKFIFDNPASKMMLAAFPKEAQNKLREFFAGNNGNS
jgi:hypothetical protein